MFSNPAHYLGPCGVRERAVGLVENPFSSCATSPPPALRGGLVGPSLQFEDHRMPGVARLTNDQAGQSVCRVPAHPPDEEWILQERRRIGRCIRHAREDHNLTQENVFLAVPMNRSFYQQVEAGDANLTLDMLLRIAWVIGIPISDLLR